MAGNKSKVIDGWQQIQGHVRIATEAEPRLSFHLAGRDHLGQDVDAIFHQIPCGMGVIGADVVLLLHRYVHESPRLKEEFRNFHVRRQLTGSQIARVLQIGIVAKYPRNEWFQEPLFQIAGSFWRFESNCSQNLELYRRVCFCPPI